MSSKDRGHETISPPIDYRSDQDARQVEGEIGDDIRVAEALPPGVGVEEAVEEMKVLRGAVAQEEAGLNVRLERLRRPYVVSKELSTALETARLLTKPLLIEGEPGTGKTSLAYALASQEDLPVIHVQCTSTSVAKDLLYEFDVLKRLQDAQLGEGVSDLHKYIRLGPLGRAFASGEPVILLIDEVDKARREFMNDLLHELDNLSFIVDETGEEISANKPPIVVITSNHERELPEPVLRRVVYNYVEFPDQEQMAEIVRAHMPDVSDSLLYSAIEQFYNIRNTEGIQKRPSTSEMLDWLAVLQHKGIDEVGFDKPLPALEAVLKKNVDTNLLTRREEKEPELAEIDDTETLEAAICGDRVLKINDPYGKSSKQLAAVFANAGIKFRLVDLGEDNYDTRKFPIPDYDGVCLTDRTTLAISRDFEGRNALYQQLVELGLVKVELREVEGLKFLEVESSDGDTVKGKDSEGHILFKARDGKHYAFLEPGDYNTGRPETKPELEPLAGWERPPVTG